MPDEARASVPIHSQRLIGRDAELLILRHVMDAARRGQGQVVLVSGEAGIGKSRLAAELMREALEQSDSSILLGRCYEQDRALPYAPLIDLLRSCHSSGFADLPSLKPLAWLLPELGDALPPVEPEQDKRRLFEALAHYLLQHLECSDPSDLLSSVSLILIEDMHWADEASLEFLIYFARRIGASSAVLLMSYRADEAGASLERFLAALDRERLATEIALRRLDASETSAMIRAVFDLPRSPQPEFLAAIHQLTDGNPFFVEEVLKSFVASGEVFEMGGQWSRKPISQLRVPRTVQAAVRGRTAQLSAAAQKLLSIAAVAGQRWDFDVLQRLTGHDETTLIGYIKDMIAAQLVVEESAESFAFRHALTRQAIYTSLLARERASLHGAIAVTIEQIYPRPFNSTASASSALDASLAHHFFEAGVWDKAMLYARRAAERAQTLGAPRAAVEHWTRAIDAAAHLDSRPAPDMQRARGQAYETLGQFDAARDDLSRALDAAQATGDARMTWQSMLDLGFLWTSRDFQVARDYFDRALGIARSLEDPVALAHTLNRVGNWHVNCEQPEQGERLHREALALFERLQNQPGIAVTLDLLAGALFLGGNLPKSMAHYAQAAAYFRTANNRRGLSSSLVWLTHRGTVLNSMLAVAPAGECVRTGEEAIALAREIDWRSGESFAMTVLGLCCALAGDYDRALRLLHDGIDIARDIEHAQGLIVGLFGLGVAHLELLLLPEAHAAVTEGLTLTRPVNIPFGDRLYSAMLARTHIAQGDLVQAGIVLDTVIGARMDDMSAAPTLAQRLCWMARAELLLALGDPTESLGIVGRLIALVKDTTTDDAPVEPRLLKLQGEALTALGHIEQADAALHDAARAAELQGARPLLWRCHVALGKLYQARAQRAEAEAHFASARATLVALADAVPDAALRERFLHNALDCIPAAPALTPLRAAKLEHDGLTEREREVAGLISRGLSNREIAESLSISQRTAGAHVGNILAKLGFGSRAQIAAWVEKRRQK